MRSEAGSPNTLATCWILSCSAARLCTTPLGSASVPEVYVIRYSPLRDGNSDVANGGAFFNQRARRSWRLTIGIQGPADTSRDPLNHGMYGACSRRRAGPYIRGCSCNSSRRLSTNTTAEIGRAHV